MKKNIAPLEWRCIGKSVKGASHVISGLPNQDAIDWYPESGIGLPVILTVSDGHGSAKSFRSNIGSRLAVETATRVIREFFLNTQPETVNFSALKDATKRLLPQRLVNEWREVVKKDLQDHPFTDTEKYNLVQKDGEMAWQAVEKNNFLAYGATLLAVLVTEFFIVYIQLGDGDILQVDKSGNTTRPLKRDPKLIANETTSLCMDKAWNEFQVHIELYPKDSPKPVPTLILVATDGYSNSFSTDEKFFKIGQDYLEMIRSKGIEYIEQHLSGFLQKTSEGGSGDDITLGMLRPEEELDQDNLKKRLTALEEVDKSSAMREPDSISETEIQINRLGKQQKMIGNKVAWVILGMIITFHFALISTVFSSYLFFRFNTVEKNLDGLKQQISELKSKSKGANRAHRTPTNRTLTREETTPSPPVSEN